MFTFAKIPDNNISLQCKFTLISRAGKSKVVGCSATATTTFRKNVACYRYYYFLEKSSVLLYFTLKKVAVLLFRYFFHYFSRNLSILFDIF